MLKMQMQTAYRTGDHETAEKLAARLMPDEVREVSPMAQRMCGIALAALCRSPAPGNIGWVCCHSCPGGCTRACVRVCWQPHTTKSVWV